MALTALVDGAGSPLVKAADIGGKGAKVNNLVAINGGGHQAIWGRSIRTAAACQHTACGNGQCSSTGGL